MWVVAAEGCTSAKSAGNGFVCIWSMRPLLRYHTARCNYLHCLPRLRYDHNGDGTRATLCMMLLVGSVALLQQFLFESCHPSALRRRFVALCNTTRSLPRKVLGFYTSSPGLISSFPQGWFAVVGSQSDVCWACLLGEASWSSKIGPCFQDADTEIDALLIEGVLGNLRRRHRRSYRREL